jgi:hypothetical protein
VAGRVFFGMHAILSHAPAAAFASLLMRSMIARTFEYGNVARDSGDTVP